jgi:hypothetical protein
MVSDGTPIILILLVGDMNRHGRFILKNFYNNKFIINNYILS